MSFEILLAVIGSTITVVGVMISLMFWMRSESNAIRAESKEDRRDFVHLVRNIEQAITEIKMESKDFHHRLLEIERLRERR